MHQPWQPLLDWWFGSEPSAAAVIRARQRLWFGYRAEQDAEARQRFEPLVRQALDGVLDDWSGVPEGWLALLLLLDQLPRMIFRGQPKAYAGDEKAQQLVRDGLAQGGDVLLAPIQRVFVYLVLEHAESLVLQEQAVVHFTQLLEMVEPEERPLFEDFRQHALRHREVVARFGRFPHRNSILGRASNEAEQTFLAGPGSRF